MGPFPPCPSPTPTRWPARSTTTAFAAIDVDEDAVPVATTTSPTATLESEADVEPGEVNRVDASVATWTVVAAPDADRVLRVIVVPDTAVTVPETRGSSTDTLVASRSVWFASRVPVATISEPVATDEDEAACPASEYVVEPLTWIVRSNPCASRTTIVDPSSLRTLPDMLGPTTATEAAVGDVDPAVVVVGLTRTTAPVTTALDVAEEPSLV